MPEHEIEGEEVEEEEEDDIQVALAKAIKEIREGTSIHLFSKTGHVMTVQTRLIKFFSS